MTDKYFSAEWQEHCNELTDSFGIQRVTVKVRTNLGRHFGLAHYAQRLIELKPTFSDDQMEDTLRHEIAHILAFDTHGVSCNHDSRWRNACAITGADPTQYREVTAENAAQLAMLVYRCPDGCVIIAHRRRASLDKGYNVCVKHSLPFDLQ